RPHAPRSLWEWLEWGEPSSSEDPVTGSALPGRAAGLGAHRSLAGGRNGGHPEDGRSGGRQPPPNKGSSPDLLGALPSGRYLLFVALFIDVNGFGAGKFIRLVLGLRTGKTLIGRSLMKI